MLRATSADRLALGSAQFGAVYGIANSVGQVPIFEIEKMIRYAREAGLDTIDTAISYGDSEDRLGDVGVSGWKVVTKLPAMPESAIAATWVSSQVKGSMKRLNVSCLYGVLLHHPGDLLGVQGSAIFEALEALQREGLVEKIGISAYGPDEVEAVTTRFPINIVQAPLNIIDRRVQESGCLANLDRKGIEFHARSIFLQGLLLMNKSDLPSQFEKWAALWAGWHGWLRHSRLTPLTASLSFVASDARVKRLVLGVDNFVQLTQVIRAFNDLAEVEFPYELASADIDLVNPSRWQES